MYGSGATGNVVQGNFIGTDVTGSFDLGNLTDGVMIWGATNNTIGGITFAARNVISGNTRFGINIVTGGPEDNNAVLGNFIGTDVSGSLAVGNGRLGVQICRMPCGSNYEPSTGLNATIDGNMIRFNGNNGVMLAGGTNIGTDNVITNHVLGGIETHGGANTIGGVAAGNTISGSGAGINDAGGNNTMRGNMITGNRVGFRLQTGTNTVGGTLAGQGNIITDNTSHGIQISAIASINNIVGNIISNNGGHGITITSATSTNTIGGVAGGAGNIISLNGGDGVNISAGIENAILSNSIFSNAELGIDLGVNGVNLNDAGDSDTGPNNLQNFPELTSATYASGSTSINGDLHSTISTEFRLEFFANDTCDPSGFGEGERFLGSTMVKTGLDGNASFIFSEVTTVSPGRWITATATDPNNNTSEFSECIAPVEDWVDIDIKPRSDPNSINLGSRGNVSVAILTDSFFDATKVDPDTVIFASAQPIKWAVKDVDKDKDYDLIFHFDIQELDLDINSIEATLIGFTFGGQLIIGVDDVNIVGE
jgi:hypothetical protein